MCVWGGGGVCVGWGVCVHLSHCCMILISLMMSWRSESTGTCLMASSCPDSLCTALNTAPYALREGGRGRGR